MKRSVDLQRCAEELWHALHNGHLAARMLRALLNALLYLTLFLCIVCTAAVCPPLFAAIADDFSFYRFLCTAYGTGGAVPWSQNADIDMEQ